MVREFVEPTEFANALAKLVAEMPSDVAAEIYHYAQYRAAQLEDDDAKWDAAFAATTPGQFDKLIAGLDQGELTGIDDSGEVLIPVKKK